MQSFVDTLAERFDVADVLYGLTDYTVSVLDATTAGVSLAGDDGALRYVSAHSELAGELEEVQQDSKQGPCHQAYTTAQIVTVTDISAHDDWSLYRAKAAQLGLSAVVGVPLIAGDRCIGALNVYSDVRRAWTDDDGDVVGQDGHQLRPPRVGTRPCRTDQRTAPTGNGHQDRH